MPRSFSPNGATYTVPDMSEEPRYPADRGDGRHVTTMAFCQHLLRTTTGRLAYRPGLDDVGFAEWRQRVRDKLAELLALAPRSSLRASRRIPHRSACGPSGATATALRNGRRIRSRGRWCRCSCWCRTPSTTPGPARPSRGIGPANRAARCLVPATVPIHRHRVEVDRAAASDRHAVSVAVASPGSPARPCRLSTRSSAGADWPNG